MIVGLVLFIGALAVIVLALTGGDDQAEQAEIATADATDSGAEVPAASGDGESAGGDAETASSAPLYGGEGIPEVDEVIVVGEPLPSLVAGTDTAVGTLAPEFTATSLANGAPVTIGTGRARVIGFFAHWCPHCQAEVLELKDWLASNPLPPNSEFIAVSTAVDQGNGNYPPSAWLNSVGFSSPVVVDDANGTLLKTFGFGGFPAFVAVDASGVVVARASGNIGSAGVAELFANFAG